MPQLRFPYFDGYWDEKKIKDICQIVGGGTPTTTLDEYWGGDINWFTPSEIGKKYVHTSNKKITSIGLENSSAKILPKGTILLSSRATIGETSIIMNESTTNQGFQNLIVNKSNDIEFVYYLTQTLQKELLKKASGSTFLEISKKEISNIKIKIPNIVEQKMISNFISKIDYLIDLLEQTLELYQKHLNQTRKELMSNKDKYVKLKDICKINKGKQLNKIDMLDYGKYYVLNGGKNPSGHTNSWNVEKNTITISEGGNSCGYVSYNYEKFYCGGHCYYLTVKDSNINKYYLYHYLKFKENEIMCLRVGSGLPNIQKRDLENIGINKLTIDKQNQTAKFLNNLVNNIQKRKNTLNRLQKFKKGLLQKMFC